MSGGMKVTNFHPWAFPLATAGWSTGITSVNSNFNTEDGGLNAQNFVQLITANGSNGLLRPIANFAAGSNITLTLDAGPGNSIPSNTIRIHSTGGGGTPSAGSNSTRVSETPSAGASVTLFSPFDHIHDGIGTVTASSSNTMQRGTLNLRPGTSVSFDLSDTDGSGLFDTITINSTGSGSGGSVTGSAGTCTADTALPQNTWTDITGCSISCSAGTYIFYAMMNAVTGSNTCDIACRITTGSTHYASGSLSLPTAGFDGTIAVVSAPVVLGGTTTIKLQGDNSGVANATARKASFGGSGDIATRLTALKIA